MSDTTPQPKKSLVDRFSELSPKGKLRIALGAVAVIALPFAFYAGLDEPNQAEVGDCMAGQNANDLRIVECADPTVEWKVVARLEGMTAADQTDDVCADHPDAEASFYMDGRRFRKGFILCLAPTSA
ncbi:MAG TPA: hypothetical protein VF174_00430 [Micromonosporaceae bacterium]